MGNPYEEIVQAAFLVNYAGFCKSIHLGMNDHQGGPLHYCS